MMLRPQIYRNRLRRLAADALCYALAGAVWGGVVWWIVDGWAG